MKKTFVVIIIILLGFSAYWLTKDANSSNTISPNGTTNLLQLTDKEKNLYNDFAKDYDDEKLKGVEPLTICKLYLHACNVNDFETQYELFIKDEKYLGWSKEEHIKNAKENNNQNDSEKLRIFTETKNLRVEYSKNGKEATIVWNSNKVASKDADGNPFSFTFKLAKNSEGIWKVCFLPMQ